MPRKRFNMDSWYSWYINVPFGSHRKIQQTFSKKLCIIKTELFKFRKRKTTFDAKSIIVKIKIMPLLAFISSVYCFPNLSTAKLNRFVLNYVLPKSSSLTMFEISKAVRLLHLFMLEYNIGRVLDRNLTLTNLTPHALQPPAR